MTARRSTGRVYRTKIRRITACLECHRRKQKCNRQRPCNICINRDVPEKCIYGDSSKSPETETAEIGSDAPSYMQDLAIDQSQLSSLSSKIGYFDGGRRNHLSAPNVTVLNGMQMQPLQHSVPTTVDTSSDAIVAILDLLPELQIVQRLTNIFFDEANWYFSVLDRSFFDRRHRSWLKSRQNSNTDSSVTKHCYFPALLFQVLAMALHFVPEATKKDPNMLLVVRGSFDEKSQQYSEAGESLLTCYRRRSPDLSSVEADIMRCAWLKNAGVGTEAWHSLGNAIRQAQDIGLHLEPTLSKQASNSPEQLLSTWDNEHKRRVWACLVTWDAHMALQLGRPRMINLSDCTTQRPVNCDIPICLESTIPRTNQSENEHPSQYTSHIVKYEIAMKIHEALNAGLLRPDTSSYNKVTRTNEEVRELLSDLPPAFRSSNPDISWDPIDPNIPKLRLQIRIIIDAFLLALHRPHALSQSFSLRAAVQSATSILTLSEDFFDLLETNQYKTFTLVFYIIDAGIFLLIALAKFESLRNDIGCSRQALLDTLDTAIKRLEVLKSHHTAAIAGQSILQNCTYKLRSKHIVTPVPRQQTMSPNQNLLLTQESNIHLPTISDIVSDDDYFANLFKDTSGTSTWLEDQWDFSQDMMTTSEQLWGTNMLWS